MIRLPSGCGSQLRLLRLAAPADFLLAEPSLDCIMELKLNNPSDFLLRASPHGKFEVGVEGFHEPLNNLNYNHVNAPFTPPGGIF
jgi:hypothetical protein